MGGDILQDDEQGEMLAAPCGRRVPSLLPSAAVGDFIGQEAGGFCRIALQL